MLNTPRPGCPINAAVEMLGDSWTIASSSSPPPVTEAGTQVLPITVALGNWGLAHRDGSDGYGSAPLQGDGGPDLMAAAAARRSAGQTRATGVLPIHGPANANWARANKLRLECLGHRRTERLFVPGHDRLDKFWTTFDHQAVPKIAIATQKRNKQVVAVDNQKIDSERRVSLQAPHSQTLLYSFALKSIYPNSYLLLALLL
jgi:hypothetical protein